jgi:hypothetical protein
MSKFNTKKLLQAHPSQIDAIAEAIRAEFVKDGFDVMVDSLMSGGKDISITKGNMFKAVLGMRSALKIALTPQTDGVLFDANVGIYGQQAIPTVITLFFFWPVLLTQIWGLIQQSSLDDRALAVAEQAITGAPAAMCELSNDVKFCTNCGNEMNRSAKFCPECGTKME